MSRAEDANDLLSATVETLVGRAAVTLDSTASVREAGAAHDGGGRVLAADRR
jgi:hypothetical protein